MRTYAIERSTAEWNTILDALEATAVYDGNRHIETFRQDVRNMLRHDDNHHRDEDDEPLPARIRNASYVDEIVHRANEAANVLPDEHRSLRDRIRLVLGWMQHT